MKILFLTTILPRKQRMGGEVASQCFIDALQTIGHDVTVMGYQRVDDVFDTLPSEIVVGQRYIETRKAKFHVFIWLLLGFLRNLPYSAAKYYSQAYIRAVKQALETVEYDCVILNQPQLAWLAPFIPDKSKFLTTTQNIENQLYFDTAKQARNSLERWIYIREAVLVRKLEHRLAATAQQVWTLTQHDAQYFIQQPHRGTIRAFDLPPGLAPSQSLSIAKEFDIGIIGSWGWKPNLEGLAWFLEEVYPQLPSTISIHLAGRGAEWLAEKYPKIHYRGFVPNAQEFMAQAKVVAIPTLTGGGIQIKTLDAIASGSSIVATPIALRGIVDLPSTVQIASYADEFAQCLIAASFAAPSATDTHHAAVWFENRKRKFLIDIQQAILSVQPLAVASSLTHASK
jgi:polysaccharide biosynthesis protein PslH